MDINGKRVLVVGMGKSGVACALFLTASRAHAYPCRIPSRPKSLHHEIPALLDRGIGSKPAITANALSENRNSSSSVLACPSTCRIVQARSAGVPVIGEIELASRYLKGNISPSLVPTVKRRPRH